MCRLCTSRWPLDSFQVRLRISSPCCTGPNLSSARPISFCCYHQLVGNFLMESRNSFNCLIKHIVIKWALMLSGRRFLKKRKNFQDPIVVKKILENLISEALSLLEAFTKTVYLQRSLNQTLFGEAT